jgi:hypothetical protein
MKAKTAVITHRIILSVTELVPVHFLQTDEERIEHDIPSADELGARRLTQLGTENTNVVDELADIQYMVNEFGGEITKISHTVEDVTIQ